MAFLVVVARMGTRDVQKDEKAINSCMKILGMRISVSLAYLYS